MKPAAKELEEAIGVEMLQCLRNWRGQVETEEVSLVVWRKAAANYRKRIAKLWADIVFDPRTSPPARWN